MRSCHFELQTQNKKPPNRVVFCIFGIANTLNSPFHLLTTLWLKAEILGVEIFCILWYNKQKYINCEFRRIICDDQAK